MKILVVLFVGGLLAIVVSFALALVWHVSLLVPTVGVTVGIVGGYLMTKTL